MSIMEFLLFITFGFFAFKFLIKWYATISNAWPGERVKLARLVMVILPFVSLAIISFVLLVMASFDVVNDIIYIFFYMLMGFTWVYFGMMLMARFLDISWVDDGLNLNNKSALVAIAGGFLGLTIIFSGANIGDGPGWGCVIFAGGLGFLAWMLLNRFVIKTTGISERITVGRDLHSGIRFGFYLLASGIVLARASAGDWTSVERTLVEFLDGWPALILTALMIFTELQYAKQLEIYKAEDISLSNSILWGVAFVAIAIISIILLPPLRENPMYAMLTMMM